MLKTLIRHMWAPLLTLLLGTIVLKDSQETHKRNPPDCNRSNGHCLLHSRPVLNESQLQHVFAGHTVYHVCHINFLQGFSRIICFLRGHKIAQVESGDMVQTPLFTKLYKAPTIPGAGWCRILCISIICYIV